MNSRFTHVFATGLLALTTGCAGSYAPIRPERIATYISSPSSGPVEMAYQFDALRLRGNKKYVKKEAKKGYHVAAVRVTNNWDREVNFSRDLTLMYGDRPITPIPGAIAAHDMKQGVAIYLLYLLLNPTVGATQDPLTGRMTGGTTLPIGPFIAGGNMLGASGANKNMRNDFASHDLTNRTLKPGETVYGILSLRESAVAPLRVEMRAATPPPAVALPAATPANKPTETIR
ncbi:hypothetical protein [Hymenobacter sp. B1770]|uniref:hypothetical protein n=1 Tax=Hymenobacter sp. B1770 TaxID=1718788 RepID=UPI003CEBD022